MARGVMCSVSGEELAKMARVGLFLTKQFQFLRLSRKRLKADLEAARSEHERTRMAYAGRLHGAQEGARSARKGMERMRTRLQRETDRADELALQCHLMAERMACVERACWQYQKEALQMMGSEPGGQCPPESDGDE
jgi:hypothetical protein